MTFFFNGIQLRNLVWATSKHDVYLVSNYSIKHWSSLSGNLSEIIDFLGHVAPTEVLQSNLLHMFFIYKEKRLGTYLILHAELLSVLLNSDAIAL